MGRAIAASLARGVTLGLLALAPGPASGFGHLWVFTEVYSNADGSVQFLELFTDDPGEGLLGFMFLASLATGGEYHFPNDLGGSTQNRHLLVATAAFASQPGAVTPDYILPDGFLRSAGDTLTFSNEPIVGIPFLPYTDTQAWDSVAFGGSSSALPTDGVYSLHRAFGSADLVAAPNSPTNFAGAVGSLVPEPDSALLLAGGLAGLALGRSRGSRPWLSRPPVA